MKTVKIIGLVLFVVSTLVLTQCSGTQNTGSGNQLPSSTLSSGSSSIDAKTILQERCSACHPFDRVTRIQKTADEWAATVKRMINKGASLTPQESTALVQYLAANYSK